MIHTIIRLLVVLNDSTSAKTTGEVIKEILCANCGARYRYTLERHGAATVSRFGGVTNGDKDKAADLARERLAAKLASDFDCTPCPACWHYQPDMAEKLRKDEIKRYEKRVTRGAIGVLVSFLLILGCMPGALFPSSKVSEADHMIGLTVFGVLLAVLFGCMAFTIVSTVTKGRVKNSFDPNRDIPEEVRRREAKRYAVPVRDVAAVKAPQPPSDDEVEILD